MKLLRDHGWLVGRVERWAPASRKRIDLFGIIDLIAIAPKVTLGVQASIGGRKSHIDKIAGECEASTRAWLNAKGRQLILVSWAKRKVGNRQLWRPTIDQFKVCESGLIMNWEIDAKALTR